MSKRAFILGVAIYVVAMAFLLTDRLLSALPGVTEANCRRIRAGMSEAEVEAILSDGEGVVTWKYPFPPSVNYQWPAKALASQNWQAREGSVAVYFDANRKVIEARFDRENHEPLWHRLRCSFRR